MKLQNYNYIKRSTLCDKCKELDQDQHPKRHLTRCRYIWIVRIPARARKWKL